MVTAGITFSVSSLVVRYLIDLELFKTLYLSPYQVDDLMNDEDEDSLGTMIDLPSSSSSEASRSSRE